MSRPVFLGAQWKHLALLNYEVEPALLLPHLPAGTELDFHSGKTYVSLVAFLFHRTTISTWIPAFFHRDFEEVNLRFYVVRKDPGGDKRAVVFIKEIVPKPLLAWAARTFYGENYVAMPMSNRIEAGKSYEYRWGGDTLSLIARARPFLADADSHARWITEHYWGYTKISPTKTFEYEVKHPLWNLYEVESHALKLDAHALYGLEFAPIFEKSPQSVFIAEGSPVTVHFPKRLDLR